MDYRAEYQRWLDNVREEELLEELRGLDEAGIEDAFYCELAFGTGGLRGVLGAGTNRMNVHTVAKASQGLADYIRGKYPQPAIAVSYDSRIKSDVFSRVAASVFAANGIRVWLYTELMPTPCLSFAVRALHCAAGIMVTASHNPARYNGYKVYGEDGCQITTEAAAAILAEIEKLDVFADVRTTDFDAAVQSGEISYIPDAVYTDFTEAVKACSVLYGDEISRDLSIVYSPLNGTGLKPVTRVLRETGFTNITVVPEQEQPDGNFPTCPYPNPEIREAMELGLRCCVEHNADLLLATDPDCDRCGIAVRDGDEYKLLSGNEVGLLLLDFICSQRKKHEKMPENPVFVKTIVTMDLAEKLAASYNVETVNVLTGFKFIGEVIGRLEKAGREADYICGFEESYGYLTGTHVRDKDAVNAAYLICEMFAFYKTRGVSLVQKLAELYSRYGYCRNTLHTYEFGGSAGMRRMEEIMKALRCEKTQLGGREIVRRLDYSQGLDGLPKSDVLQFRLEGDCSLIARPSGTEPKLKLYCSVTAADSFAAADAERLIIEDIETRFL